MPKMFSAMRKHFEASQIRPAMELQARGNKVISIFIRYGVIAAVKAVLGMRGINVGIPRAPHIPLEQTAENALRTELEALDFAVE